MGDGRPFTRRRVAAAPEPATPLRAEWKTVGQYTVPAFVDAVRLITGGYTKGPADGSRRITAAVWHTLEGYAEGAISHWNGGAAGAHFIVRRDGSVLYTCLLNNIAWHAGTSADPTSSTYGRTAFWRLNNINPHSVGIEIEGFAHRVAYDGLYFTPAQVRTIHRIAEWLMAYGIRREHTFDQIAGHHAHGEISAQRSDPGPYFNWDWVLR